MGNALNWFTKPTTCRRWTLYFFTFAVLSTLIFAVPVLADLGKSAQAMSPRSGMLIPLYIYPTKGAWDPLYDA
jgi:hypothetical protein